MAKRTLTEQTPMEASGRARLRATPKNRPPFALYSHPERYEIRGGKVIPDLIRAYLRAGVNNVTVRSDGSFSLALLDERMAVAHCTRIPWSLAPNGVAYYVTDESTGECFSAWDTPYEGSNHVDVDTDAYVKWCQGLMADGHVPAPADHVLTKMLHAEKNDLRKARNVARARPGEEWQVETAEARVKILEGEIKARQAAAKPRKTQAPKVTTD